MPRLAPATGNPDEHQQPMRDVDLFPDRRTDVVLLDYFGDLLLYGHRLLEEIRSSGESQPGRVYQVPAELYLAYLQTHFPNYPSVQRLLQSDQLDPELLRTVSYQVRLERGDADYMMAGKHRWEGKSKPEDQ
jgi:hypothetical protein